jgi:uncharacterized HAD superfamily protein
VSEQQRVSDQLVRLVQVFFALVLAQSLVLFKKPLLDPFAYGNRVAILALLTVFYTTVASWIDWHVAIVRRPYDTRQFQERYRVYADLAVAMLYAYLVFTIEPLVGAPYISLTAHLLGYPLVFALYLLSGLLRRMTHGKAASKIQPILMATIVYSILVAGYDVLAQRPQAREWMVQVNVGALLATLFIMWIYRKHRRALIEEDERRANRLTVGVDVDGVLADQITGVLPRIATQHGVTLTYADVRHWRLPIKNTNIADEIVAAQSDRNYVLNMTSHEGAKALLNYLHRYHRLLVTTARAGDAGRVWTAEWLHKNGLPFDEVATSQEARKSVHAVDVLIDDYTGNIKEFLDNSAGVAVLIDQPWNQDRTVLSGYEKSGRFFVATSLLHLRSIWPEVAKSARGLASS